MPRANQLAHVNLAIRGIDGQVAHDDTFHNDRHPDLSAAAIFAGPPFDISDWGGERQRDSKRWRYAAPPAGNDKLAWVPDIFYHGGAGRSSGARTTRRFGVV